MIKARKMRLVGREIRVWEKRNAYRIRIENPQEKDWRKEPGVDERVIMKAIIKKLELEGGVGDKSDSL